MRSRPLVSALAALALCGCTDDRPEIPITQTRVATVQPKPFQADATSADRFGRMPMPRGGGSPHGGAPTPGLDHELPPGWKDAGPRSMREINLLTASGLECYVSHAGGSLLANVNRWMGQLGQPELDADALAALPTLSVLGKDATYVEQGGTFKGKADHTMLAVVLPYVLKGRPGLLTVKLVGPADKVQEDKSAFEAFCGSLAEPNPHAGHNHPPGQHPGEEDPHAGHDHPPGQHPGESPQGPAAPPSLKLSWTAPTGWEQAPKKAMREVTFTMGETECYVSALRGAGGGVEANVKRWRKQLGVDVPINLGALPRVPMLGRNGIMIRAEGTYTDMKDVEHPGFALLGAICKVGDMTVFVKMVGPKAEVDAQKSAFLEFCESLKRDA